MLDFGEKESKSPRICINTQDATGVNEEQIRYFVQALDMQMKIDLFEFLKSMNDPDFRVWMRVLSEEIQRHDTESRFPLTRSETIEVLIKIMRAYEKLPEYQRKTLWEILGSDEMKITIREVGINEAKIIALNKAVHDIDSAEGAVELISLVAKNSEDRKELALAGIRFVLNLEKGNPEAAFRLLKLIDEEILLTEEEKQTISRFLKMLDADFLEIHLSDKLNKTIKKLIVERLIYCASELRWVPKTLSVKEDFRKHNTTKK